VVARIRKWSEDWNRVWTPELRALTFYEPEALDVLERHREAIAAAPLRPNFEGALLALAEREPANAKRALTLGAALYPDSTLIRERLNKLPQ
jgi:hypothetical protein